MQSGINYCSPEEYENILQAVEVDCLKNAYVVFAGEDQFRKLLKKHQSNINNAMKLKIIL